MTERDPRYTFPDHIRPDGTGVWPRQIEPPPLIRELASHLGRTDPTGASTPATIDECALLPDGSGFATMSFPLPKTHWLYFDNGEYEPPPMSLRMLWAPDVRRPEGQGALPWSLHGSPIPPFSKVQLEDALRSAGRYAVRAATMKGKENDFDPDALIQNLITGALGYHTPDGLTSTGDEWANPPHLRGLRKDKTDMTRERDGYDLSGTGGDPVGAGTDRPRMGIDSEKAPRPDFAATRNEAAGRLTPGAMSQQGCSTMNVRHVMIDRIAQLRRQAAELVNAAGEGQREADGLEALMNALPLNLDELSPLAASALVRLVQKRRG